MDTYDAVLVSAHEVVSLATIPAFTDASSTTTTTTTTTTTSSPGTTNSDRDDNHVISRSRKSAISKGSKGSSGADHGDGRSGAEGEQPMSAEGFFLYLRPTYSVLSCDAATGTSRYSLAVAVGGCDSFSALTTPSSPEACERSKGCNR
jgi:hypothetical protein